MVSSKWKSLSKKLLLKNPYLELWEEEVLRPDGGISTYYVQRRKPFSVVIPLIGENVYLVQQYRYSVSSLSWEFPMGYAEGKTPLETAEIELKEETGMSAKEMIEIGKYWFGPGRSNQWVYVYVAKGITFGEAEPEEGELLRLEEMPIAKVGEMIEKAEILDGVTITAYHFLEKYLNSEISKHE